MFFTIVVFHNLTEEIVLGSGSYTVAQSLACFALQSCSEIRITLVGYDCQLVNIMHVFTEQFLVLTDAVLVNADTQATANLLTFGGSRITVAQRAYLEHIRIIPALAERGMGEYEACRFQNSADVLYSLE